MLRWAVIFLVISLAAGALGFANISEFTRKVSFILFGLFFLGFLILLGFALLVADAVGGVSLGTDILMAAVLIPARRHSAPEPAPPQLRHGLFSILSGAEERDPRSFSPQAAPPPKPEDPSRRRTADRQRTANLLI